MKKYHILPKNVKSLYESILWSLLNLVRLPHSFTYIPHSSYLSLFFISTYKCKLDIVSVLSSIKLDVYVPIYYYRS